MKRKATKAFRILNCVVRKVLWVHGVSKMVLRFVKIQLTETDPYFWEKFVWTIRSWTLKTDFEGWEFIFLR